MCTLGSIHSLAYRHKHDRSLNDDIERTHQPYQHRLIIRQLQL